MSGTYAYADGRERARRRATDRILALLAALESRFTLGELSAMISAGDLSPLWLAIDAAYAGIGAETAVLFTEEMPAAGQRTHAGVVLDLALWRIASEQADVRTRLTALLSGDQKRLIRELVDRSRGQSPTTTAMRVRNALGLTDPLVEGMLAYERVVLAPHRREGAEAVTIGQLAAMTRAYAQGYRRIRATAIGLVEANRAIGRADREAWAQAGEQHLRDLTRVVRIWHVTGHNTRDSHWAMDEQERGIDQPFLSGLGGHLMYPGDASASVKDVANCNCWLTYDLR